MPPGILPVSAVIVAFFVASGIYTALEPDPGPLRIMRPVYALLGPAFSPVGLLAIVAGASLVLLAWRALSGRVSQRLAVGLAVAGMMAFAASAAALDGTTEGFTAPLERTGGLADYYADVDLVEEYGVRGISLRWREAVAEAESIHTATHPPGPLLVLAGVRGAFGEGTAPIVAVQGMLSVLVLFPAWLLARRLVGARAALIAVLLLAVAPSPVLHTFTSMDAVFATAMVTTLWLLVRGLGPAPDGAAAGSGGTAARAGGRAARAGATAARAGARAFIAGAAVGLVTLLTYAAAFLAAFGVLYAFAVRGRDAIRLLIFAAAGGGTALLVLWLALGFDVFSVYAASHAHLTDLPPTRRTFLYGIVGSPMAWLAFAGLPLAGLAVRELLVRRPPWLLALVLPVAVFFLLPQGLTGIIPLETERTLQFAYPLAAAAAGAAFVRWESAHGRDATLVAVVLVAFTAAQTIAMEAVYDMFW